MLKKNEEIKKLNEIMKENNAKIEIIIFVFIDDEDD
jgi:hypothetical protein